MKKACNKGISVLLSICMVLTVLSSGMTSAKAAGIVNRTTMLNLNSASVQYSGGKGSANPLGENITDTAEGWSWYLNGADTPYDNKTLVLDNIHLETSNPYAIILPAGATIVLAEDSNNSVRSGDSAGGADSVGILGGGSLTIKGAGTLNVQSGNATLGYSTAIDIRGALSIIDTAIIAITGSAAVSSNAFYTDSNLTITQSTVTASSGDGIEDSYNICSLGNVTISDAIINVQGGSSNNNSGGICSNGPISITGSTIDAIGGTAFVSSYGIASFTNGITVSNSTITSLADEARNCIGVYADSNISITGGTVTAAGGNATEGSYGILSYRGQVGFNGGTVYAKSDDESEISYAVLAALGINDAPMTSLQKDEESNYTQFVTAKQYDGFYAYTYGANLVATDVKISFAPSFEGSGTEDAPYLISSADQLKEMSKRVNFQNGLYGDKHYKLTADIVLNLDVEEPEPELWEPIGNNGTPFTGSFDGNGYTIRGLYINSKGSYLGLFGIIDDATVKNLGLVDGKVISSGSYATAGGLVGFNFSGIIENCFNTGSVTGTTAGGIVGINAGGHIQNSYNIGHILGVGDDCSAGGIAGENTNADLTIVNCYNTGIVEARIEDAEDFAVCYVGGITGQNRQASIKNCYSSGELSANVPETVQIYLGGIAGYSDLEYYDVIENAYWLHSTAALGIGGQPSSEDCFILTDGPATDGCTAMTAEEMKAPSFIETLNNNVDGLGMYEGLSSWKADTQDKNGGYPVFGTSLPSYTLTIVDGGTGATESGSYPAGTAVTISAGTKANHTFSGWTANTGSFDDANLVNTTFTMPDTNATITAHWTLLSNEQESPSSTGSDSSDETVVLVDGKQESAGTTKTERQTNGKTITTVTVDSKKLETILASKKSGATVTIPITSGADKAAGLLTGQMVKSMENKDAKLIIKTGSASYTLPASEINIDAISKQLGTNVSLADITVSVSVAVPSDAMAKVVANAEKDGGYTIMVPAVDFTIACTYGEKVINVSLFNRYIERTIAIPDGIDPNKITTGIVVDPDGTVHHVPTRVTIIDGRYYAVINSLTNSTYSVIWNPVEFNDMAKHWARDAVNNMGSRMVVTGVGGSDYDPDRAITRAEFAAIVVRALGLEPGTGTSSFADVNASDWCYGYISTAVSYGIIKGYNEKTFGPDDTITREQTMTMLARAMKVTGLKADLSNGEADRLLASFHDASALSNYASESAAACLKTGIVAGRSGGLLASKDYVTRAEAAVMAERLLRNSHLI